MTHKKLPAAPGLPGDPTLFGVLTEIAIIAQLTTTAFERVLPEGLTQAQFGVLHHLLRLDAVQTIGELASAFQVTQPTMSSTVKRLLAKGYVEIVPDKEDRRIKRVSVTEIGRDAREKAVKTIAPHIAAIQQDAPDTDWASTLKALTELRIFFDERR
ncbi:MAG: MarR family transcriptional regulator [Marinicaulis sp.]|nr:MarR family transcriptional regulator [Marinicaulis sp.]